MTIYEALEGHTPWKIQNEKHLKKMFREEIKFEHLKDPELQKMVLGCLKYEKEERISAEEALSKMEEIIGLRSQLSWDVKGNKEDK